MIRAGIIGAAGYTAGELLRILLRHPEVSIVFAQSSSHAGEPLWKAHADLFGDTDLTFSEEAGAGADVVFLCGGHGKSVAEVEKLGAASYKGAIIDLSADYRLAPSAEDFVYGLPEAFRDSIRQARHIANPGCFATAMQLALLPFAGQIAEAHVTGITGSTGAGQKPSETTHFSWRSSNMSVYKPFTHQHLAEVLQTLRGRGFDGELNFVPVRGDFTRGIMVSAYFDSPLSEEQAVTLCKDFYAGEPFVRVADFNPDLKMVVGTNNAVLHVRKYGRKVHVLSFIDNLVKGASGQAVENMNLVFGLPEDCGLRLRALRF